MPRGAAPRCAAIAAALAVARGAPEELLIKGVSYGPVPLASPEGAAWLPQDDWMADDAVQMWGPAGRFDLRIIRGLGANLVRLYGNNPENDHTNFLDVAHGEGLRVSVGMSDYPYFQMQPGSCQSTEFDCYSQIKPLYAKNLQKGFLTPNRTYHPALRYLNILNEPDLKMPAGAVNSGPDGPKKMCKAIISAMDAILDAEREAMVSGPLINFTATFSYAICSSCERYPNHPALGQMMQLDDAMHNPGKYGYTPKNDLLEAYRTRFTHSFNTANPATDLENQFLNDYSISLPGTPVYIGEYHHVFGDYHAGVPDQATDLQAAMDIARSHNLFLGVSYFQYQVAYWKGGSEEDFGMFGLTKKTVATMSYFGQTYPLFCLTKEVDKSSQDRAATLPDAVAKVYGGAGVDVSVMCPSGANPHNASLDQAGYEAVLASADEAKMAAFVRRVVAHMGANPPGAADSGLGDFVRRFAGGGLKFADMASELAAAEWARPSAQARCVADRTAPPSLVGPAIGWICGHAKSFSCEDIPEECKGGVYPTADYVLSRYYQELGAGANPLTDCYSQGAGVFESPETFLRRGDFGKCVQGARDMVPPPPPTPAPSASTAAPQAPEQSTAAPTLPPHRSSTRGATAGASTARPLRTTRPEAPRPSTSRAYDISSSAQQIEDVWGVSGAPSEPRMAVVAVVAAAVVAGAWGASC